MVALFVLVAIVGGHGGDRVGFFRKVRGGYVEVESLIVAVLGRRKFFLARLPALRQLKFHDSLCGALGIAVNRDRQIEGLGAQGNNTRLRSDRNGNGWCDDERFEHRSWSRDALHGLNHLGNFKRHSVKSKAQSRGKRIGSYR